MSNRLIDALDVELLHHCKGENGSDSYTQIGVKDARVALAYALVRGISRERLNGLVQAVLDQADSQEPEVREQHFLDLFSLCFQTRDINEGKGERDLFRWFLLKLYSRFKDAVLNVMQLIPKYGCWKDLLQLWKECDDPAMKDRCLSLFHDQLLLDGQSNLKKEPISLCAKWAPREGSQFKEFALQLAEHIYKHGTRDSNMKRYRRMISELCKTLNVVESQMCKGTWADIKPSTVPGKALKIYRKAFMNETLRGHVERVNSDDRIRCRQHFLEHLKAAINDPKTTKVHGDKMFPHELVKEYANPSCSVDMVIEAQYQAMVERFRNEGKLGSMVVMTDVSGSMMGLPMHVAVGLTAIVSKINHPAFRHRYMSFSSKPRWHLLGEDWNLYQIVRDCFTDSSWGMNTNFAAAMDVILDTAVRNNVPPEDMPRYLLVLSDMQFDQASNDGSFEPHWKRIVDRFHRAGYNDPPTIIFWNLRGDTVDFPASADTPGVEMISGFSPTLLKIFMEGDYHDLPPPPTPYDTFRKQVDTSRYDLVRDKVKTYLH